MDKRELLNLNNEYYSKLIEKIIIGGCDEKEIKDYYIKKNNDELKENKFPKLKKLFSIPFNAEFDNFDYIYPDQILFFEKPQFFYTSIKNKKGFYDYIYSLKYNECLNSDIENKFPISIIIISKKEDPEQFKLFLFNIYNKLIINTFNCNLDQYTIQKIKPYKKLEFLNILFFSYSNLFKSPPHSTIRLLFPQNLNDKEEQNEIIDFYFHSYCEIPCNKIDKSLLFLFSILDIEIIIKIIFLLLTNKSVELVSSNPSILSIIIPAFIKLIFPLKYENSIIPVLPIVNSFKKEFPKQFFGLINNNENFFYHLNKNYVVIDCDINQIYNDKKYDSYSPLLSSEIKNKNLFLKYYKNRLMKYNNDKNLNENERYQTFKFLDTGKVIIDCDKNNTLLIENTDNYLSDSEYKEIRKKINIIKHQDLNLGGIIENNYNIFQSNINQNSRSVDYKLNKLFAEIIYQKIMNEKDSLVNEIKKENYYMNFKKEYLFDNQSPQSIMRNLQNYGDENSFYNSFIIKFNILNFPFEKAKQFLNGMNNFNYMIEDYNYIKNIGLNENDNFKENKDNEDLIDSVQMNFYGENGVIRFFNSLKKNIGDKENEFYNKCYNENIFEEINNLLNSYEKKENKQNKENNNNSIIEFSINNTNDYYECPNFYLYIAFILQKMKESNIYSDSLKNDYFNKKIINFYNIAYKKNNYNFPFFDFYSFLISLNSSEMNEIKYSETEESNSDLEKLFEKAKENLSKI